MRGKSEDDERGSVNCLDTRALISKPRPNPRIKRFLATVHRGDANEDVTAAAGADTLETWARNTCVRPAHKGRGHGPGEHGTLVVAALEIIASLVGCPPIRELRSSC